VTNTHSALLVLGYVREGFSVQLMMPLTVWDACALCACRDSKHWSKQRPSLVQRSLERCRVCVPCSIFRR
jgi:hypothetical protein